MQCNVLLSELSKFSLVYGLPVQWSKTNKSTRQANITDDQINRYKEGQSSIYDFLCAIANSLELTDVGKDFLEINFGGFK